MLAVNIPGRELPWSPGHFPLLKLSEGTQRWTQSAWHGFPVMGYAIPKYAILTQELFWAKATEMKQIQEKPSALPNLPQKVKHVYKGVPSPPFWEGQLNLEITLNLYQPWAPEDSKTKLANIPVFIFQFPVCLPSHYLPFASKSFSFICDFSKIFLLFLYLCAPNVCVVHTLIN